jgi:NADPH-dependent glutamate synthase beta subunit-like oxidoreductase
MAGLSLRFELNQVLEEVLCLTPSAGLAAPSSLVGRLFDDLNPDGPGFDDVAVRLAQPDLADVRAIISWRGAVSSSDLCPVQLAIKYLELVQQESCGRCGPCRIGTDIMLELLRKLAMGEGTEKDVDTIRTLAVRIEDSAWCGIGNTVRDPILALLDIGGDHMLEHARGTTCPAPATHGWVTAPCRSTCPSNLDIPAYIFQALEEHTHLATQIIKRDNPLPAIIGRTCPHPCEANCTLAATGQPIAINNIKRWCADRSELLSWAGLSFARGVVEGPDRSPYWPAFARPIPPHEEGELTTAQESQRLQGAGSDDGARSKKVAIIGAGPAGLSAAYYLARRGYRPVIFEALPVPGGMLHVGIPEYRLPRDVIRREVELIEQEGAEIRYNQRIGRDFTLADLERQGFEAFFVAIGAHKGRPLQIPGEDLPGSMDAIDFLRRVALGEQIDVGQKVLVLGGGNSAMDAARTAVRLGASDVTVVYRRTLQEMPANPWEIEEAEEEGVKFHFLAAPVSCHGEEGVTGLVCQQMELGPPDESGRRRPVPADMAPFVLEADTIIAAVGQRPDFSPFTNLAGLEFNRWGFLEADPHTLMTGRPGVFVGGDAVSGGGTIIEAIRSGKVAASYIEAYLRGEPVKETAADKVKRLAVYLGGQQSRYQLAPDADYGSREPMPMVAPDVRKQNFEPTELGYTLEQAKQEAARCLRCHRPILVAFAEGTPAEAAEIREVAEVAAT